MHGWCGEGHHWDPWRSAFAASGWRWQSGERGYGEAEPFEPGWQAGGRRVLIGHSMGPHLLRPELLADADAVVLLASFGRFVPAGGPGRRLRSALEGMAAQLREPEAARTMLRQFMAEAAAPEDPALLPAGPAEGSLNALQRQRLADDLALLARTEGLPSGFPAGIPVLVVEAAQDRIVVPEARALLREALQAQHHPTDWLTLADAGHCLLQPGLVETVQQWLQGLEGA